MLRSIGFVTWLAVLMVACGGGSGGDTGGGGGGGGVGPLTALTYTSPVTGTVGEALTPLVPTLSGHADSFWVYPSLPAGLILHPATGIVSGTPTSARLPLSYTVSANNLDPAYTNTDGAYIKSQLLLTVDPPPAGTAVTGVFRSDTVIGLGYVSGAQSGVTNDSGEFTYELGQGITFSVGQLHIGALPMAKALITPVDLVAHGTGASNQVLNVVRFLMMLDQDLNINNGIQISAAVTAAAAGWAPVDFDTADLPTTLDPLIQRASAADGVSHVLPDAATAQVHLRTAFYCTHAGSYYGTFGADSTPGTRGDFIASVFLDGSMRTAADGRNVSDGGAAVRTAGAVSPLLDATFAGSAASPSVDLQGSFADVTYLSGTFQADVAGDFQAVSVWRDPRRYGIVHWDGDVSAAATYKFESSGGSVRLGMDDSNRVSGGFGEYTLSGTVSGNTFTGTVRFYTGALATSQRFELPVSGTYSNTASGATLDGQFSRNDSVITFSTVGCRAN